MKDDLPLLNWTPPQKVIPFPSKNMIGKARHVALKCYNKPTDKALQSYMNQIAGNEFNRLLKIGLNEGEADKHVQEFMAAVSIEFERIVYMMEGSND